MGEFKLACFDLDGTLIDNVKSIWQFVHEALGTDKKARRRAIGKYYTGKISYSEWAEHDVMMWRKAGLTRDRLESIISSLKKMYGADETLNALRRAGFKIAVISGSLRDVLDFFFPKTFDYIYINEILWNGNILSGIRSTEYDQKGKAKALREICGKEGIKLSEVVFIGDHDNDVEIAREAGLSIAFNCESEKLISASDAVVEGKDLRKVLPLIMGRQTRTKARGKTG